MKNIIKIAALLTISVLFGACEAPDPFVDRVVSPVLVVFESSLGSTTGFTTDPSINATYGAKTDVKVKIYELDKTGILDNTVGIDSIPLSNVPLVIKFRGGSEIGTVTTDAAGTALLDFEWSALGVTAAGQSVSLSATGSYDGQQFTKLFKVASK